MTVAQEATELINRMPLQSQRVVLDMLKLMLNRDSGDMPSGTPTKRTGVATFSLPADFDEHFDDANDEIAKMFYGD